MVSTLKKTASKCSHIATTYSIGRSFEGKDLFVIEFSTKPGHHELRELYSADQETRLSKRKQSLLLGHHLNCKKNCLQNISPPLCS